MQDKLGKQTPIDDFVAIAEVLKRALGQRVTGPSADGFVGEQRLYERWLRQDEWRVRSEALPLLLGVEPAQWPELIAGLDLGLQVEGAWDALKACIARARFPLLTGTQREEEEEWGVHPLDLYHWARAHGLDIPPTFEQLAQFVATVIKHPHSPSPASHVLFGAGLPPQTQASAREKILGAALNVLAKCPGACRDEHGLVSGEAITKLIGEQCIRWFDTQQLPADATDVAALIDRWLE
ncbi:MAG: hypothetical protein ACREYF_27380 [Gammaproteobacteria bacterium]